MYIYFTFYNSSVIKDPMGIIDYRLKMDIKFYVIIAELKRCWMEDNLMQAWSVIFAQCWEALAAKTTFC